MGYKIINLKMPTGYTDEILKQRISKELHLKDFTFKIENKSLDARKKANIFWLLRVVVSSPAIQSADPEKALSLNIPYKKRNHKVLVTGSGPAGFFAAYVLQSAGFDTILIERGADVFHREEGILDFERNGNFSSTANYSFGEGGAGTFSDGKLTSRSKHITAEREFIISCYIGAGAPEEIRYMAYPHLGSDNLKHIVKNLRKDYTRLGGEMRFETQLLDLIIENRKVKEAVTNKGNIPADLFIIAPGHSAFETYRMLMKAGIEFRTKNFAIGTRVEHRQDLINLAQWGTEELPGVKAAEYRLTSDGDGSHPVYTFCMCPGGMVVPASAYEHINIVNGMSNYRRNGRFANAACVAGIHPDQLAGHKLRASEALDWLEKLEASFFDFSGGYKAPYCSIEDFLMEKDPAMKHESSYPLGLKPARLWEMLPPPVSAALKAGLKDFTHKIKGYEKGIMLGLESKTSSPIQVLREKNGLCEGTENLFLVGEGSGYAGGIISSGADGIRAAISIVGT